MQENMGTRRGETQSSEREGGKGPSEGGVWGLQCQKRDGPLERAEMKGTIAQEYQRPLVEHSMDTMGSFKNAKGSEGDGGPRNSEPRLRGCSQPSG